VHSTLITFGHQLPMADLFGDRGREMLRALDIPEPWRGHVDASVELIDELELRIAQIEAGLQRCGADHRYVPILLTAPGFGWITSLTVACELGDRGRFSTPQKFVGYTGLCPRVSQSGDVDLRGPVSKRGPRYLRWGLIEAATHACSHPLYKDRYQRLERRDGRQRGAKVAQIDLSHQLATAIW
jgi:transposase